MGNGEYDIEPFWLPERVGLTARSWSFHMVNSGKPINLSLCSMAIEFPNKTEIPLDLKQFGPSNIWGKGIQLDFHPLNIPHWKDGVQVGEKTILRCKIGGENPSEIKRDILWKH
jgi:hypothetical protein